MEEILYELRDHASGLNAGRWDYLFSMIKNFRDPRAAVRPAGPQRGHHDRPVHARLHRTAGPHLPQARRPRDRRHGGRSSPPRRDPEVNAVAFEKVTADKTARPATASTAPGWPTPTWSRSAASLFDARPRRPAEPAGPPARGRPRRRPRDLIDVAATQGTHHRDGLRTTSRSASATSRPGCAASAPSRSTT